MDEKRDLIEAVSADSMSSSLLIGLVSRKVVASRRWYCSGTDMQSEQLTELTITWPVSVRTSFTCIDELSTFDVTNLHESISLTFILPTFSSETLSLAAVMI